MGLKKIWIKLCQVVDKVSFLKISINLKCKI